MVYIKFVYNYNLRIKGKINIVKHIVSEDFVVLRVMNHDFL